MKKEEKNTFWITNICNRNITLPDLYISVPAMSSINLLDKRHYYFTEEQLNKSFESGSLFDKKDKIYKRNVPPQMITKAQIEKDPTAVLPSRTVSIYEIKQENYEELNITDEALIEGAKLDIDNLNSTNKTK